MSISVTCSHCGSRFRAADELAGRRAQCGKCRREITIPGGAEGSASTPAADAAEPAESPRQPAVQNLAGAFEGAIPRTKVPWRYRLGILVSAALMILLPLVYIGLIGVVIYAVALHLVFDGAIFEGATGARSGLLLLLIYIAPVVIGGILIVFMIKPLFARPGKQPRRRSLTREGEPVLFAFVEQVCAAVGAPVPRRIDVDCQVNASASFRQGWVSMFRQDLALTIGMPLVAGLNMRQFAGVLAHEFGHFSQGAGMRLSYVVRSISWWFTRVVYQRDAWDEWLAETAGGIDIRIGWMLHVSRLMVWLTRRVLWVLMTVGHCISGFLLRQMEFDADRYEARLAGSDTFERTAFQLTLLNVANSGAQSDLSEFYREGRLCDNLPLLITANVCQIPPETIREIREMIKESRTGLFDTHPCDLDRIKNAGRENAPGIFRLEGPAHELFHDFKMLCKNVTYDYYKTVFGRSFRMNDMHPTEKLLQRRVEQAEGAKTLDEFFLNAYEPLRPIRFPAWRLSAPENPQTALAELKQARRRMVEELESYKRQNEQLSDVDGELRKVEIAEALRRAHFRIPKGQFPFPTSDDGELREARRVRLDRLKKTSSRMEPFETAAGSRLFRALEMLHVPVVAARLSRAESCRGEADKLFVTLGALTDRLSAFQSLRMAFTSLQALCQQLEGNEKNQDLIQAVIEDINRVVDTQRALNEGLTQIEYPFDHAKGPLSLASYFGACLSRDDLGAVISSAGETLERFAELFVRATSRLTQIALLVEKRIGLSPLTP